MEIDVKKFKKYNPNNYKNNENEKQINISEFAVSSLSNIGNYNKIKLTENITHSTNSTQSISLKTKNKEKKSKKRSSKIMTPYDKSGKPVNTVSKDISEQSLISKVRANQTTLADITNATQNQIKSKVVAETSKNKIIKKDSEKILPTINNTFVQLGKGISNFGESALDTGLQIGSSDLNPFMHILSKDKKANQKLAQELIAKDGSAQLLDTLGYNKKLSNGKTVQQTIDDESYVKSNNFEGQIVQGIGNMLPSIIIGNTGAGNIGASTLMGLSAYGSGVDEAYKNDASRGQANLYGLGNAGVETATEWLTGGIPGVNKLKGVGLDNIADAGLDKISNNVLKEGAKIGYKALGEGAEEGIAEIINPYLKNATYSKGEKINWSAVKNSALAGAVTGAILNAPSDIINMKNAINGQSKINSNIITPAYGKNNYDTRMEKNIIYDIDTQEKGVSNRILDPSTNSFSENNLSQISNMQQPQNYVPLSIEKRLDLNIDNAIKNKQSNNRTYLGKMKSNFVEKINRVTGVNTQGMNHVLTDNDIRHMLKQHGNPSIEAQRGQIAITTNDIKRIPEIINNPNNIIKGSLSNGKQTIRYIKNYTDNKSYVVEVIPHKGKSLIIKTMWKKPSALINSNITPDSTSITEGSVAFSTSDNNIPQSSNIVNNSTMQQNRNNVVNLPVSDEMRQKLSSNKVTPTNEIKQSNLQENLNSSNLVNEEFKSIVQESDMGYEAITNKDTMDQAKTRLDNDINSEVRRLMTVNPAHATALDIAELIQLQYQYQQNMDIKGFQDSVDKLRQIGTSAGQATQAFSILQRMSPEGMVYYAQRDLQSIFDSIAESKNQQWIDKNKEKFSLNEKDIKNIIDRMNKVQELNIQKESVDIKKQTIIKRQQKILLGEVQKIVNDKIPTNLGNEIKSFRRISMLFNPKTQIRNIVSNVLINPLNRVNDRIGAGIDRLVSNETGIRTTGATDYKAYAKGFKEGITNTVQDYKLGIDTDGIEMNKFDIGRGKSFNQNTQVGKVLNEIDRLNSTLLKLGDAPFFQAEFNNSLQNQMKLNNVKEPTLEMILNAREVALERTWQDNNNYTQTVLTIRNGMNKINYKGFGLGDIVIPFAKTPANLTKAMVDYSPIGFTKTLLFDVKNLNNAISKGENVTTYQRKVVNNMSKGITGTLTYLLAMTMSNLLTGERDKDKDKANFEKDVLGIQPYSFKIGNKTFTYDWAMPLSTPFAIIADMKDKDGTLLDKAFSSLGTMGDRLIEQSFLQGISNLFSNWKTGGFQSVAENLFSDLPSSFVPTFLKQINDLIDPNQRIQYEKGNPLKTSYNKAAAKIPLLSKTLSPKKDVLGNDVKKFGGANNFFNVFLNPANVNVAKDDKVGQEIKRLYEVTGSNTVVPKVAPYLLKLKQENITLNSKQQSEFQELSGKEANRIINKLLDNDSYLNKDDDQKADIITKIVNYAYNRTKEDMFDVSTSGEYESISEALNEGIDVSDYLIYKESIDDTNKDTKKSSTIEALLNTSLSDEQKGYLYSKMYTETDNIINANIPMNAYLTLQDRIKNIEAKRDTEGKIISGSKKRQVIKEIANLPISNEQKLVLIALQGYSVSSNDNIIINKQRINSKQFRSAVFNYVNKQPLTADDKRVILEQAGYKFYENGKLKKTW